MNRMARSACAIALAMVSLTLASSSLTAQLSAGVVLDRDGLRNVHLAIGQVFGMHAAPAPRYLPRGIHPDELPVVHFIAREARVSPEAVIALRSQGWSWMDVAGHLRVRPSAFVRHLPRRGPPHGRAHGYWSRPDNRQLAYLSDQQVVDYVNLWFWSRQTGYPAVQVIGLRDRYPSWSHISMRGEPAYMGREAERRGGPPAWAGPPAQRGPGAPGRGNRGRP